MPSFNTISRRHTPETKYCKQGGKLDYGRYSQVSLLTLYYHWQTLSISFFLLDVAIAKDH